MDDERLVFDRHTIRARGQRAKRAGTYDSIARYTSIAVLRLVAIVPLASDANLVPAVYLTGHCHSFQRAEREDARRMVTRWG